jgi:hypothetical protein
MAKECTEPLNLASVQCRNCDEYGHMSKDCPKPRDRKSTLFCYYLGSSILLTTVQWRVSSAATASRWAI